MPQTKNTSSWPARSAFASIVVTLNKCDMVDDEEILELVELEVRELLSSYEFPRRRRSGGFRVAAFPALNGDAKWGESISSS